MLGRGLALALFAAVAVAIAAGPVPLPVRVAYAACEPGTKIDSSTADQTRKKLEAAGYHKVRGLTKGCDNVWHATAEKDGVATGVALTPDGQAYAERD